MAVPQGHAHRHRIAQREIVIVCFCSHVVLRVRLGSRSPARLQHRRTLRLNAFHPHSRNPQSYETDFNVCVVRLGHVYLEHAIAVRLYGRICTGKQYMYLHTYIPYIGKAKESCLALSCLNMSQGELRVDPRCTAVQSIKAW